MNKMAINCDKLNPAQQHQKEFEDWWEGDGKEVCWRIGTQNLKGISNAAWERGRRMGIRELDKIVASEMALGQALKTERAIKLKIKPKPTGMPQFVYNWFLKNLVAQTVTPPYTTP